MNIPYGDVVHLLRKEELVGLVGRELTKPEWTKAKRILMADRDMWACVDSTLMLIVDEIRRERI